MGLFSSIFIKLSCPVPKYWLGSLIIATIFSNTTDLPIAYVTTLAGSRPFVPEDGAKGTAYSMIFAIVFIFAMFNMGSYRLVGRDGRRRRIDMESGNFDIDRKIKPGIIGLISQVKRFHGEGGFKTLLASKNKNGPPHSDLSSPEKKDSDGNSVAEKENESNNNKISTRVCSNSTDPEGGVLRHRLEPLQRITSSQYPSETPDRLLVIETSTKDTAVSPNKIEEINISNNNRDTSSEINTSTASIANQTFKVKFYDYLEHHTWANMLWELLYNFTRPPSAMLFISLLITMIPTLRHLFYLPPDISDYKIKSGPDGQAVLSFVMDFASFVGAAQVPVGIMLLGASISRLKFNALPNGFWKTVTAITLFKLVLLPIASVAWTQYTIRIGWIDRDNRMASLIMILSAGMPVATSHVILVNMYTEPTLYVVEDGTDDEGNPRVKEVYRHEEMDCLAVCVIVQYACLFVTTGILLTYSLKNVVLSGL